MFPTNPLHAGPPARALLVALDAWITDEALPPPSRYPSRDDGTLVPATADAVGFPQIPGVHTSDRHRLRQDAAGQRSRLPSICSKTDADGRDIAGVHLPTLAAPVATHTGWNFRKSGFAEGELCDNNGSMFAFPATREERVKNNDPRLSLAERYPKEGDRAAAVSKAANQLVQDRLLLEQDVKLFMASIN